MINKVIVMSTIVIIIACGLAFLLYKGKKKLVLEILGLAVHKAEVYFNNGENQEKIKFVMRKIEDLIPLYLRWLWNEDWIMKQIDIILLSVEKELGYDSKIQSVIDTTKKDIMKKVDAYVENAASGSVNWFATRLLAADVNGDKNLVDNNQIKLINTELQEKLKKGVNLKAFANIKTNFYGNTEGNAGVEIKKSF